MPILPRAPQSPPQPHELEDLARTLASLGASRSAIELVERWAETGEPTPAARIAEARSFVDLRLVDRAWSCLRDLVEAPEPRREAVLVAVELFLLREWHERARKLVTWAVNRDPSDPALRALQARASEPATTIEPPNVDPDELNVAELVHVAEHHMAHGAFIKARSMLERARRRSPQHPRVQDLLWALAGDFSVSSSLDGLYHRLGDSIAEVPDETEQTEYLQKAPPGEPPSAAGNPRFSKLFRSEPRASGEPAAPGLSIAHLARADLAPSADAPGQRTIESSRRSRRIEESARGDEPREGQITRWTAQPTDASRASAFGTPRPVAQRAGNSARATPDRGGERTAVSAISDLDVATRRSPLADPRGSWSEVPLDRADGRSIAPAEGTDGGDDTQIARVVHRGGHGTPIDPASLPGVDLPESGEQTTEERRIGGEAEDDSVVVHTRRPIAERDTRPRADDPLRAAEAEANHERLANRWRREENDWAAGPAKPSRRRSAANEVTERLGWTDEERAWFNGESRTDGSIVVLGRRLPVVWVAGALLGLGFTLLAAVAATALLAIGG